MLKTKYRAAIVIGGEELDVTMNFETDGETLEECDAKARAELADHAQSILKASKNWKLWRLTQTEIPARETA